ncbi:hypothetical protein RFI_34120, partial [Reticulomyxa filosa]
RQLSVRQDSIIVQERIISKLTEESMIMITDSVDNNDIHAFGPELSFERRSTIHDENDETISKHKYKYKHKKNARNNNGLTMNDGDKLFVKVLFTVPILSKIFLSIVLLAEKDYCAYNT